MVKLLLDENIDSRVTKLLRSRGYDASSIAELKPGLKDAEVLKLARKEKRILITHDRDFGRLVFLHSKKHTGVVYIRLKNESVKRVTGVLSDLFSRYEQRILKSFTTVSDSGVRFR